MRRLTLEFMGAPQLQLDHVPVIISRRAVVALLAYLSVSHRNNSKQRHTRESLSALLWPDYSQANALANLRHTLWEVSQSLGDGWIIAEHETVYLKPDAEIELDVERFYALLQEAAQQSNPTFRMPLLEAAIKLYRGPFMAGFSLKTATDFNEWVFLEAENLRRAMISAITTLVEDKFASNQAKSAIPFAQRLLLLDPLNEAAYRQLMQIYAMTDQPAAALQQYQMLEKLLRKELNLDPRPETRDLYKKIRRGELEQIGRGHEMAKPEMSAPKHNLSLNLTTFVGRENERVQISRLIEQNRLVTLIGTGGIGKTRLALQVGQDLLDRYSDGVWFVSLDSLAEEERLPQRVASVFGIAELPGRTILEVLISVLHTKTMLMIVDNCEHLLEACAQFVETLLKNCRNLKVLATSREILGLEGECFYSVPALMVPRNGEIESMDSVVDYEAMRLFLERSRLVLPNFDITKENFPVIVEICSRLDGIPLAIELAAARVNVLRVEEILKQLTHSFDLLAGGKRSVSPRHQTLRASISWSWELLTSSERVSMRRLSVFAGGWAFPAVQVICGEESLELISALVKKSLVVVEHESPYETRYHFHDIVRQYAQQKLLEAEEEKTIRDRHLNYFLEMCRKFNPALRGIEQVVWLERLFLERDNIRAAMQWAAKTNVQAGLYLAGKLRTFWENNDLPEERRWLLMI